MINNSYRRDAPAIENVTWLRVSAFYLLDVQLLMPLLLHFLMSPTSLLLLREDFDIQPWLVWCLLCRPGWPQIHRNPHASFSGLLGLKGVLLYPVTCIFI